MKKYHVKVISKILQELILSDGGMSGWEVETKRFILNKERVDINSEWESNYQNIDIYKPFIPAVAA